MAAFKFESSSHALLPWRLFLFRVARHGGIALAFILVSMMAGMAGYHAFAGLSWMDSFLNASMILTGMGPVNPMQSNTAKIFSGIYALYSGIAFLTAVAFLFAPILHRMFHKFHLDR